MQGNQTGTSTGAVLVAHSEGARTFDVPNPLSLLRLNLNASCRTSLPACNGELRLDLYPPDCQGEEASPQLPNCAERHETSDGSLEWTTGTPEAGSWSFDLWRANPGFGTIDWTLEIHARVPVR